MLAAACAPRGKMTVDTEAGKVGKVETIFIGTTRDLQPDGTYGNKRSEVTRFARYAVSIPPKRKLGEITRFDMPGFKPRPEYLREMKRYGVLGCDVDPAVERVDPYVLDRRYWDALVPGVAKDGFPRVTADPQTGRVTGFDRFGEPVWVYTRVRPLGAWRFDDGSVLVPYLPSAPTGNRGGVRLVSEAKHTLLDFRLP